jgi:hypothetical protein
MEEEWVIVAIGINHKGCSRLISNSSQQQILGIQDRYPFPKVEE